MFVINEWLWADLSGQNGRQFQRETLTVIETFPSSTHQMVIIEGSAFDHKAWNLCRNDNHMIVQTIGGLFVRNIRQNSDRCLILKPDSIAELPADLAAATKADDHYLIQAMLTVHDAILVTTDNPLRLTLTGAQMQCLSREQFLEEYILRRDRR